ncbi:HugZ family protein [Rhodovulum sp. 12E13]|uniref:HugZ family pyridoxamine 5'-phosphate oxidase n=1 Tax=Rhodovulum sp. 12E13 TaxID=2203891 RepID=UPI000E15067D|nr:pyridoxamine 5'-phosphate oxidase family protein [Rhodovulum sp. 12E13]RDC71355.1 HugZ family protein [Rhodovulum sp. 12E13]
MADAPDRKIDPIRETDDEARTLARSLIDGARFGALGVRDPETGAPMVSRVAVGTTDRGAPMTLVSDLSHHTRALKADPVCSLLVGEPGPKGDPLTHPRITLQCRARFVRHGEAGHAALRDHYLGQHPKAQLYIDFADFSFAVLDVAEAHLNGGFGKAYRLTSRDLGL